MKMKLMAQNRANNQFLEIAQFPVSEYGLNCIKQTISSTENVVEIRIDDRTYTAEVLAGDGVYFLKRKFAGCTFLVLCQLQDGTSFWYDNPTKKDVMLFFTKSSAFDKIPEVENLGRIRSQYISSNFGDIFIERFEMF